MIEIIIEDNSNESITYTVLIDDKVMAEVKANQYKKMKLRSNNYKIQIVSNKSKSNIIDFTIKQDLITFICKKNYKENIFSRFFHMVILKNSLKLRIK